jgi:hypothetical protein
MGEACALAAHPLLYRIRLMLVGAVEPVAQVGCRLIGCLAVEGHHGRWNAGNPDDVRPPALFGYPGDLDHERAARYSSFKTMAHVLNAEVEDFRVMEQRRFYVLLNAKQAKRSTKGTLVGYWSAIHGAISRKEFFAVLCSTGNSPSVNRFSTRQLLA